MPIVSESGLVLIAHGGGFDVYGPTAGMQIGYIEPYLPPGATKPSGWLAFSPQYLVLQNSRNASRHFRTRKAAAEALFK